MNVRPRLSPDEWNLRWISGRGGWAQCFDVPSQLRGGGDGEAIQQAILLHALWAFNLIYRAWPGVEGQVQHEKWHRDSWEPKGFSVSVYREENKITSDKPACFPSAGDLSCVSFIEIKNGLDLNLPSSPVCRIPPHLQEMSEDPSFHLTTWQICWLSSSNSFLAVILLWKVESESVVSTVVFHFTLLHKNLLSSCCFLRWRSASTFFVAALTILSLTCKSLWIIPFAKWLNVNV